MNLNIKDFISFATYNGLFDNVPLINHPEIEQSIVNDPEHKMHCIINNNILWTIDGWICECKRLHNQETKSKEFIQEYKARKQRDDNMSTNLRAELLDNFRKAILAGNVTEAMKIKKQLEKYDRQ